MVAKEVGELCDYADEFSNFSYRPSTLFSNATAMLDGGSKLKRGGSRPSHAHLRTIKSTSSTTDTFKLAATMTCDNLHLKQSERHAGDHCVSYSE